VRGWLGLEYRSDDGRQVLAALSPGNSKTATGSTSPLDAIDGGSWQRPPDSLRWMNNLADTGPDLGEL
jgi:hypothetical protein